MTDRTVYIISDQKQHALRMHESAHAAPLIVVVQEDASDHNHPAWWIASIVLVALCGALVQVLA